MRYRAVCVSCHVPAPSILEIPPTVVELVPESLARENIVMPLAQENGAIKVIMHNPLDFDTIEKGASRGLPKSMEWYAAFGLMVTLIWLYIEILNLLIKLRNSQS